MEYHDDAGIYLFLCVLALTSAINWHVIALGNASSNVTLVWPDVGEQYKRVWQHHVQAASSIHSQGMASVLPAPGLSNG